MKRAAPVDFPLPPAARLRRPLWRSLELAMAWQIDIGRVPSGGRVPSTRAVARSLGLSRNTVALAFDALVADGYLVSFVGDGTYVLPHECRARAPLWRRRWHWARDPDGLALRITS